MPDYRRAAHRTLTGLQPLVEGPVRAALRDVAHRFAAGLDDLPSGDEGRLVDQVAGWWDDHAVPIARALLALFEAAVDAVARWLGVEPPAGFQNLPGRFDDDRAGLPGPVIDYLVALEARLFEVGDNLRDAAQKALTDAAAAGEDPQRTRQLINEALAAAFAESRVERIAGTETVIVWNAATADAVRAAPPEMRPAVKQWLAVDDHRTRLAHRQVDGTVVPVGDAFDVAGVPMTGPGDPTAPLNLWLNCRCVLLYGRDRDNLGGGFLSDSEVNTVISDYEQNTPGGEVTAAAAVHTGAMIALVPSAADAERLAVTGGEPVDELHLTLYFLGDADTWTQEQRDRLVAALSGLADSETVGPVMCDAFGAAHWNPGGDDPAWVWSVGDNRDGDGRMTLAAARNLALDALDQLDSMPELPAQHSPWVAHVTAAYSSDDLRPELTDRLGPITFDRIRVAFAGEYVDIPLTPEVTAADAETVDTGGEPVPWSTPGNTAIAFENVETGDGRVFAPGALYWTNGPWPLQYAEEMLSGHDGAELAGAILTLDRDGGRIAAAGVLYPSQSAGRDAIMLLGEGAPLGVSVDLDDVDIEVIDRSGGEDGGPLLASLASATVMRLADGGYSIRVTHQRTLTAGARLAATVTLTASADGIVPAGQVRALTDVGVRLVNPAAEIARLAAQAGLTAAAGDPDQPDEGTVVDAQRSGDVLLRITRARVRGATLVAVPAFAGARISLDGQVVTAADAPTGRLADVVTYVSGSPVPVDAATAAKALGITAASARDHLARAANEGLIVRLARGLYIAAATLPETRPELTAATYDSVDRDDWGDDMDELEASAWQAMRDLPAMPAAWFTDPSDMLDDGGPGVRYANGRIYGWVAKAGVPHAGFPGRDITVEKLAREGIDFSNFLRQRITTDSGETVKVGPMTMGVGHHRDSAECETAACQFDDSRTVAGIVTVGLSKGGLWFSGAAAPWLSDWDRQVFMACSPSYHLKKSRKGWDFRAVLSVPVPGHPTPLVAAVVDRSNLALAASAAPDDTGGLRLPAVLTASALAATAGVNIDLLAAAVADELERRAEARALAAKITAS